MNPFSVVDRHPELASQPIVLVMAFVFGAVIGSFLNVVIARLPEGMSIVRPRSHCPRCGDMIPSWLNVPILSWLVLRGRCRACKLPISIRYPMIELLTGVLFVACLSRFGLTLAALTGAILASALVVITFIDIKIWEIPDEVSLPGIVVGAVLRPFAFGAVWWDGLLAAALGAGVLWLVRWVYELVRKKEGMGLGDLKLLAMIGAFLGVRALLPTILVASFAGTLIGGPVLIAQKLGWVRGPGEDEAEGQAPAEGAAPEGAEPAPIAESTPVADGSGGATSEDDDDDDDWEPPPHAVPFGPFLALGALAQLFLGEAISRMLFGGLF